MGLEIIKTPVELVCYWKNLVKKRDVLLDKAKTEQQRIAVVAAMETYEKCAEQLDHLLSSLSIQKDIDNIN